MAKINIKMNQNPLVSIIMATYNRAHLIVETLHSIQAQTYQNWECLIIDDGGTDNTLEVITPFFEKDKRFQYLKRPEKYLKGANSCRNIGFNKSNGQFILWFDSDDILHPSALQISLNRIVNHDVDFCRFEREIFYNKFDSNRFSDILININYRFIDVSNLYQILMNEIAFGTCNVIWRKSIIGSERFNENLVYADEWEYFSRLISNKLKGISLDINLLYVRKHPDSTTSEFQNKSPNRINSKKKAILLVTQNMMNKQLMTPTLLKYLVGYAISFRDNTLLNDILTISKTTLKNRLYLKLKFILFPIWKIYKKAHKKITK